MVWPACDSQEGVHWTSQLSLDTRTVPTCNLSFPLQGSLLLPAAFSTLFY